jgi:hypothetical protein
MFTDHPAGKLVTGVVLGGIVGVLAFESVRFSTPAPVPAPLSASATAPAAAQRAPGGRPFVVTDAGNPVSVPGGAAAAPSALGSEPALLTGRTTFACAARPGAPTVNVGWALSVFDAHPAAARSNPASMAPAKPYSTAVAWGSNSMALAVSCSPGSAPANQAVHVAQAAPALQAAVPVEYPGSDRSSLGLQVSGLFKPAIDAMP